MPQDVPTKSGTQVEIDLRKASGACKLPYLLTDAVIASRVGRNTSIEFLGLNQNELANAIVQKETTAAIEATVHSRVMLAPQAVLHLHKQLNTIIEALIKENPSLAEKQE